MLPDLLPLLLLLALLPLLLLALPALLPARLPLLLLLDRAALPPLRAGPRLEYPWSLCDRAAAPSRTPPKALRFPLDALGAICRLPIRWVPDWGVAPRDWDMAARDCAAPADAARDCRFWRAAPP